MSESRHLGRESIASGRWIKLEKIRWRTPQGEEHDWEVVGRTGGTEAVFAVAILRPSGDLLLVEQYRPALDGITLEFPAGLVDPGEDVSTAALREIKEETGYTGTITRVISPRIVSAGISSERIAIVEVDVDEEHPDNQNPCPKPEGTEDIRARRLPRGEWEACLEGYEHLAVDAKVSTWLLGRTGHG